MKNIKSKQEVVDYLRQLHYDIKKAADMGEKAEGISYED